MKTWAQWVHLLYCEFMVSMIFNQVKSFNQFLDPYDNPARPSPGYSWQLTIFHPGAIPGELPPARGTVSHHNFCSGASGSDSALDNALEMAGKINHARQATCCFIPVFIGNDIKFF